MAVRPLPRRCWLLTVEHTCGVHEPVEWHDSVGGDGLLPLIAEVWAHAPDAVSPLPVPWQPEGPCLVVSCEGCGVRFGAGEGEHFETVAEALVEVAEAGWVGQRCGACVGDAGAG